MCVQPKIMGVTQLGKTKSVPFRLYTRANTLYLVFTDTTGALKAGGNPLPIDYSVGSTDKGASDLLYGALKYLNMP